MHLFFHFKKIAMELQAQILFAVVSAIVIFIIFGVIQRGKSNKKQQKSPPVPAGAQPVLGHLHLFGKNQLIHRKLGALADEYGPAYLISLGFHKTLVVSSWDVIKECFTTNDKIFPTRPRSLAAKLMGYDHALMGSAPYGPYWRHTRKIATVELLSNKRLELLKHFRETEINDLLKKLYEKSVSSAGGIAVVQMKDYLSDLTMNVIVKMMTGKGYGGVDGRNDEESKRCQMALDKFFYLAGLFTVSDAVPYLGWIDVLSGTISKFKKTAKELDGILSSWVNEHRERRLADGNASGDKDFIDVMLTVLNDGKTSKEQQDITIKATCQVYVRSCSVSILATNCCFISC